MIQRKHPTFYGPKIPTALSASTLAGAHKWQILSSATGLSTISSTAINEHLPHMMKQCTKSFTLRSDFLPLSFRFLLFIFCHVYSSKSMPSCVRGNNLPNINRFRSYCLSQFTSHSANSPAHWNYCDDIHICNREHTRSWCKRWNSSQIPSLCLSQTSHVVWWIACIFHLLH